MAKVYANCNSRDLKLLEPTRYSHLGILIGHRVRSSPLKSQNSDIFMGVGFRVDSRDSHLGILISHRVRRPLLKPDIDNVSIAVGVIFLAMRGD